MIYRLVHELAADGVSAAVTCRATLFAHPCGWALMQINPRARMFTTCSGMKPLRMICKAALLAFAAARAGFSRANCFETGVTFGRDHRALPSPVIVNHARHAGVNGVFQVIAVSARQNPAHSQKK